MLINKILAQLFWIVSVFRACRVLSNKILITVKISIFSRANALSSNNHIDKKIIRTIGTDYFFVSVIQLRTLNIIFE